MTPDPVFQPWQSPYNSMDGNPINLNDPMGDYTTKYDKVTYDSKGNRYGQFTSDGTVFRHVFNKSGDYVETQIQQDNGEWASWGYVSNIVDMAPVDIILESKATKERKEKFRNRWNDDKVSETAMWWSEQGSKLMLDVMLTSYAGSIGGSGSGSVRAGNAVRSLVTRGAAAYTAAEPVMDAVDIASDVYMGDYVGAATSLLPKPLEMVVDRVRGLNKVKKLSDKFALKKPSLSGEAPIGSKFETDLDVADAIDGVTPKSTQIAKGIRNGEIKLNLLDDKAFQAEFKLQGGIGKSDGFVNPLNPNSMFVNRNSSLSTVVHEGNHVLDFGNSALKNRFGPYSLNSQPYEFRSFYQEGQFNLQLGGQKGYMNLMHLRAKVAKDYPN